MKIYALPMLLSLSLSAPVFATDAPPPPAPPKAPAAEAAPEAPATTAEVAKTDAASTPDISADMSFESLQKARAEHMKAMHERMAKIWATEDPEERQKLMEEHQQARQAFRKNMRSMMQEMNQAPMPGYGPGPGYGRGWGQGMGPGYGRGWGQGMGPGYGRGWRQGQPGKERPHRGRRGGMMCPQHAAMEERVEKLEALVKQLSEKQ